MIISFVIPVYNTAKYIKKCVGSIIGQGIDEDLFEVIIINDGSTDNSRQVLDDLEESTKHLKIIHTPNRGLGAARNLGITESKGKYIFFVDSDDYILDHSLKDLIVFAQVADYDIIGFNWEVAYPNGRRLKKSGNKIPYNAVMRGAEYFSKYNLRAGVCFYLYLGSFLRDTPILMPEGMYHEDELFLPQAFTYASQIIFVDQVVYVYCQRSDSITNSQQKEFVQRRVDDSFRILDKLISLSEQNDLNAEQQLGVKRKITFFTIDFIVNLIRFRADENLIERTLKELYKRDLYPLRKEHYGLKYEVFRILFNSKNNILRASKLGLFTTK